MLAEITIGVSLKWLGQRKEKPGERCSDIDHHFIEPSIPDSCG